MVEETLAKLLEAAAERFFRETGYTYSDLTFCNPDNYALEDGYLSKIYIEARQRFYAALASEVMDLIEKGYIREEE